MHNPVCVKCECEMRIEKNDVRIVDHNSNDRPYQIWAADKWKCPKCGMEMVIGFGKNAYADSWTNGILGFKELLETCIKNETVVNCKL